MPQISNTKVLPRGTFKKWYFTKSFPSNPPSQVCTFTLTFHQPFSSKRVPLTAPAQNGTLLNTMKRSMIPFPPHLLEPTASFTVSLPNSNIPNRTHFSSRHEPTCPARPKEPVPNLPLGHLCFLLQHPTLSPHFSHILWLSPTTARYLATQRRQLPSLCYSQGRDDVTFLNAFSTPGGQHPTGRAHWSELRTLNSAAAHTGSQKAARCR